MQSTEDLPNGIERPTSEACTVAPVHTNDDDPLYLDNDPQNDPTFVDVYSLGEPLFAIDLALSRDWESQETENGMTVNTRPDQTMFVFAGNETDYVIAQGATPMNIVATAQSLTGDLVEGLTSLLYSTEMQADGIESFTVRDVDESVQDEADELELRLHALIDAAEDDESYSAFEPTPTTA